MAGLSRLGLKHQRSMRHHPPNPSLNGGSIPIGFEALPSENVGAGE